MDTRARRPPAPKRAAPPPAAPDMLPKIIEELAVMAEKEREDRNPFKVRAYEKVIAGLKALGHPVRRVEDLDGVEGIGQKIRAKIEEILSTGHLAAASAVRADRPLDLYKALQKIYGVGPAKAKTLIEKDGIRDLDGLRARAHELLHEKQRLGLEHYDDLLLRIPRAEMERHDAFLRDAVARSSPAGTEAEIVGSYRRGLPDSGDIDMLVSFPPRANQAAAWNHLLDSLGGYVIGVLARGPEKFMAICRLPGCPARRLDILCTPRAEYPYAILYFTGSDKFNVAFRKRALERGYTLNEHALTPLAAGTPPPPEMRREGDIFAFLGIPYVPPAGRVSALP